MRTPRHDDLYKKITASIDDDEERKKFKVRRDSMLGKLYKVVGSVDDRNWASHDKELMDSPFALPDPDEDQRYRNYNVTDQNPLKNFGYDELSWKEWILEYQDKILTSQTLEDLDAVDAWREETKHILWQDYENGIRAPESSETFDEWLEGLGDDSVSSPPISFEGDEPGDNPEESLDIPSPREGEDQPEELEDQPEELLEAPKPPKRPAPKPPRRPAPRPTPRAAPRDDLDFDIIQ